ncbi:hypothetical protein KKC59_03300, partial [bacterium]|nr:hypothetical protein [bacterium]
ELVWENSANGQTEIKLSDQGELITTKKIYYEVIRSTEGSSSKYLVFGNKISFEYETGKMYSHKVRTCLEVSDNNNNTNVSYSSYTNSNYEPLLFFEGEHFENQNAELFYVAGATLGTSFVIKYKGAFYIPKSDLKELKELCIAPDFYTETYNPYKLTDIIISGYEITPLNVDIHYRGYLATRKILRITKLTTIEKIPEPLNPTFELQVPEKIYAQEEFEVSWTKRISTYFYRPWLRHSLELLVDTDKNFSNPDRYKVPFYSNTNTGDIVPEMSYKMKLEKEGTYYFRLEHVARNNSSNEIENIFEKSEIKESNVIKLNFKAGSWR